MWTNNIDVNVDRWTQLDTRMPLEAEGAGLGPRAPCFFISYCRRLLASEYMDP